MVENKLTKDSEERFRAIFENANDVIAYLDKYGKVLDVNKKIQDIFGYTPDEVIGKHFARLCILDKKNLPKMLKLFKDLVIKNKLLNLTQLEISKKNGDSAFIEANAQLIRKDGKVQGVLAVIRDITARKKAEEALKESEEKHRLLYETSGDAIMTLEPPTWKFTSGNPATVKIFKTGTEERFVSLGPWELSPKCQPDGQLSTVKAKKMIMKAMKEGTNFFEWTHKRFLGEDFPATVLLTRMETGGRKFLQATVRDISAQKTAEEALLKSKDTAESYLNIAGVILVAINTDGKVTLINKKGCEVLGYKEKDIVGKDWFDNFLPKRLRKTVKQVSKKILAGEMESLKHYENPVLTKSGEERLIAWNNIDLKDEKGNIIGHLSSGEDITERKRNANLVRAQRDLALALNSTKRLDEGLRLCFESALKASGMDCGGIYIFEDSGSVKLVFNKGLTPEFVKTVSYFNADNPHTQLIKKGKPIYTQHHQMDVIDSLEKREGLKAIAVIPIVHEKKAIGCMNISSHFMEEVPMYSRNALEIIAAKIGKSISLLKAEEEKAKLQEKLKHYAKRLEIKVKKLEKNKINLTEKEKLVFYGITAYPHLNDRELAGKINLNRSTITAIRHRLRKQNLYHVVNIPNLKAVGCESLSFIYGKLSSAYKGTNEERSKFEVPGLVCFQTTDTNFFALFAAENLVEFHKSIDPLLALAARNKIFEAAPATVHFPLELGKVYRFFNYAPLLAHLFELEQRIEGKGGNFVLPKRKLTKNMKEVLYALVKYPEATTTELAKKLRVTRATVKNNENMLMKDGFVQKAVIPNLKKMGCELVTLTNSKFNPETTMETRKEGILMAKKRPHAVLKIGGDKENIAIRIFKDYSEHIEVLDKAFGLYKKKGFLSEDPAIIRLLLQKTKFFRVNFASLTKKMLDIEVDI